MFTNLSNETRHLQEKRTGKSNESVDSLIITFTYIDHRLTGSKSYNDALDEDNLDELNIAPSLK